MKKAARIIFLGLNLTGCFWGDDPQSETKLIKDFWLNWYDDESNQFILLVDNDSTGGIPVINHTVFSIGYNDNFIIAKQHPDKEEEISERLFRDKNGKVYS